MPGSVKHRVPKLLNLINTKMVPYIKENELILNISLDLCILLLDIATVDCFIVFVMSVVFLCMMRTFCQ